jgi:hypothetical protein
MFEDWKKAWREAVENFRREVAGGDAGSDVRTNAMRRELVAARGALDKLDGEIRRTRSEAESERANEQVCRRREQLARSINDEETVRIAASYAARHAERAQVLERKVEVLEAERGLLARDLGEMEKALAEQPAAPQMPDGTPVRDIIEEREREDRDFGRLEREARERAAEERLEELKRKMR